MALDDDIREQIANELLAAMERSIRDVVARLDQCEVCHRVFLPKIKPGRYSKGYCDEHKIDAERARKRRWAQKQAQRDTEDV